MKRTLTGVLAAVVLLGCVSIVSAADRPAKLRLTYSFQETVLDAPTVTQSLAMLTGKDKYTNDGNYWGLTFESPVRGRFGIDASLLFGSSDEIEGGDFTSPGYWNNPSPNANPLTNEKLALFDVNGTFTVLDGGDADHRGLVDLTLGYWSLDSQPDTSKANAYAGLEVGLKGLYSWKGKFMVDGEISYVPSFTVRGNVDGTLDDDYVLQYRVGADYFIVENFGVSLGYQGLKLMYKVIEDGSDAEVTLSGFYFGVIGKY